MNCQIIILAAGNGRRMESELPKVMHEVGGLPMIERVILNARQITSEVFLVHSSQLEKYIIPYKQMCQFVLQPAPLGTADAVHVAIEEIDDSKTIVVLYGDNPLITTKIIKDMLDYLVHTNSSITTLCFERENPGEYGRIVTDSLGEFLNIVEFKDATEEEKAIKICNSGIMAFKAGVLTKYLPLVFEEHTDKSKELYLTSIIKTAKNKGEKVSYLLSSDENLVLGINNKQELEDANRTINALGL
ncbi:MAG: NTP transferase domain-containing protein [Rickettsia endosymbiont of Bryobia graminum]|nr:NTP transferase domain-containing protein [Rickettsia endosymbiont of Bryobia graminum]